MLATTSSDSKLPANEATERMEIIAGKSRTLVYALDEIVWAVDPERDTLSSVARYLASYVEEYLAGVKVACRVQIPNSASRSSDFRRGASPSFPRGEGGSQQKPLSMVLPARSASAFACWKTGCWFRSPTMEAASILPGFQTDMVF